MRILRQRWLQIFAIGLVLFGLADLTLRFTDNVNYFPTVMMLGTFLVPVAFVAFFYQQEAIFHYGDRPHRILPTVLWCALLGGLIGTLAAGTLEYETLATPSPLDLAWVGPIEEFSKLLVPVALFVIMRDRFRSEMDGLLFGVVAGMAFAALESMGYELVTLLNTHGSLAAVDETILARGLLSPAGHASWTGIITATLWRERERSGRVFTPMVVAFFLLAASLHSLWDYASSLSNPYIIVPAYFGIGGLSLGLLVWRLREARRRPAPAVVVAR